MKKVFLISISLLLAIGLTSCGKNNDTKKEVNVGPNFDNKSEQSASPLYTDNLDDQGSGFNAKARKEFYALSTTGTVDLARPEEYLSPRWNAIIGYDRTNIAIPVSEIDKASNSDLDKTTFNYLREQAMDLSEAALTGIGKEKFSTYFSTQQSSQCTNYFMQNAGVASLPISQDGSWIIAVVFAQAKCINAEELHSSSTQQYDQTFFFNRINGQWIAVPESYLPRR